MAHISIRDLSVEFAIFGSSARSLKNTIVAQATGGKVMAGARDIVAVRAIDRLNLEINDGDRIGLVGHNGSGKTTLLRVLSGIYKPVAGRVTIEGKVGTLLDPQAGMDNEATGIENIYLRGYVLGMNKRQIEEQIDDIAEFTDLGDFLHLPMRTYSAGMAARLAFGISTAIHNDILLIDEGIGAGDAEFQDKAQKRIESLFARTSIVLLASHSEDLITKFCNRRLQMEHGKLIHDSRNALGDDVSAIS
jgi:ABC-type polysaccharide/polyol phosphate transport system ATPase subunit|tara:strand:- start:22961 stop:23704 length:744 start_codon:yes stop_codon:yes gene_type:complete